MAKTLLDHAKEVSNHGDHDSAYHVMRWCAEKKGWTAETFKARWDGARALLDWWHKLEPAEQLPLDLLLKRHAEAFIAGLEEQGLARSTIKGYRAGARALTRTNHAIRCGRSTPDTDFDPFRGVQPSRKSKPVPQVDEAALESFRSPRLRAKLDVLLALLASGFTVAQACSVRWDDVKPCAIRIGPKEQAIGVRVINALEKLAELSPKRKGEQRVLWHPDTARRWLKKVITKEEDYAQA